MQVPLLNLTRLHLSISAEIQSEIDAVLKSQQFIQGPAVKRLEAEIAGYCGVANAIGCASGTDALYLALLALDIGPGDEVITTAFSFFATAGAIVRAGATPVFVDIDAKTFNLDPALLASAAQSHPKARAIIAVHLFGGCADMDPILATAKLHGLTVIEDAAQAIGASYKNRNALSMGEIGCLSFFPSKNLGAWGDGGMLTSNNEELAAKLTALREHGSRQQYLHEWVGINSRLDAIQASVLLAKLRHLDGWTEARRENANRYRRQLTGLSLELPSEAPFQTRHVYNQFVIKSPQRDALKTHLADSGIGSAVYYPLPLHLQPCFANLGCLEGDFPVSEQASKEVLALPIHPMLTEEEVDYVAASVRQFCV